MIRGLLALVLLVGLDAYAHAATPVLQTQHGAVVHWSKPIVEVGLDPRFGSQRIPIEKVRTSLQEAMSIWNQVKSGQPQFYFKDTGKVDVAVRFCRPPWRGGTLDLGHSQFTADPKTGIVDAASIEINECDREFFPSSEAPGGRHSLVSVLAHELGHSIGLGHSDDPRSLMYPTGDGANFRAPHESDASALATIYLGRFPATGLRNPGAESAPVKPAPKPSNLLPTNATALLTVRAKDGRELVVYTSEASLLPPLGGDSNPGPPKKGGKKRNR